LPNYYLPASNLALWYSAQHVAIGCRTFKARFVARKLASFRKIRSTPKRNRRMVIEASFLRNEPISFDLSGHADRSRNRVGWLNRTLPTTLFAKRH
jgi:hypothetical protein